MNRKREVQLLWERLNDLIDKLGCRHFLKSDITSNMILNWITLQSKSNFPIDLANIVVDYIGPPLGEREGTTKGRSGRQRMLKRLIAMCD